MRRTVAGGRTGAGPAGISALALVTLGALGAGCKRTPELPGEPTGGRWRPILLPAPGALAAPPPPADGTPTARAEQEEVLALVRRRSPEDVARARRWAEGAVVAWNETARDLVAKHRVEPVLASRVYALLSVAQYDALVAVWNNKATFQRPPAPRLVSGIDPLFPLPSDPGYPSDHAAVAGASAAVLSFLFPEEATALAASAREHEQSRLVAGVSLRSDVVAGDDLGRRAAELAIRRAREDGAEAVVTLELPKGEGRWQSAAEAKPVTEQWGRVKPWLLPAAADVRAPPPPPFGSPAFQSALAEVRRISDARTSEQKRNAALWADGLGSYTPAGRWNKIAADLILRHHLGELRAARVLALLNMALMDAGIACWDSKYHYCVARPSQLDPAITTPVGLPNFPSYPSAHACFSGAGAGVLSELFPVERAWLGERAEEAALSRVYGGIHYRFDGDAGLALGRAVAELAKERARTDGAP